MTKLSIEAICAKLDLVEAKLSFSRSIESYLKPKVWFAYITLERNGITVSSSANGLEAAEAINSAWEKFDQTINGGMKGIEVLAAVRPPLLLGETSR